MNKSIFGVGLASLLVIFSSFLLPFIQPSPVKADHGDLTHPYTTARAYSAYSYLRRCSISEGYTEELRTEKDINSGNVFYHSKEVAVGYLFANEASESANDGEMACTTGGAPNPGIVLSAVGIDPFEVFVSTGILKSTSNGWVLDNEKFSGSNQEKNLKRANAIKKVFESHFSSVNFERGAVSRPMTYYGALATFNRRCVSGSPPSGSNAGVRVSVVDTATGEITVESYLLTTDKTEMYVDPPLQRMTCTQIKNYLNDSADITSQAVSSAIASGEEPPSDAGQSAPGSGTTQDCQSGSGTLGWIMCPIVTGVLNLLENVVDPQQGDGLLFDLLNIDVLDTSSGSDISEIANGFRTLANILLVVAFLFIIFSTSLSIGPEAYTVKKTLPKLIVAGILTQLSLFVGGILIDFFNILGYGIGSLILSPIDSPLVTISGFFGGEGAVSGTLGNIVDGVLGSAAIVAGTGYAIWLLILTLPTIALAVAAVLVILGIRKLLIILMIVAMPIAFALYIFPSTEKIAKEWFDNLIKMLAMFPLIIALVSGGALLASMTGAAASGNPSNPEEVNFVDGMISLIALFGPYALIPFTFKFAGRAFGAVTGGVQRLQSRAGGGRSGAKGGAAGGAGLQQKYQDRVNKLRSTTAAGKGAISGSRIGAPLRGLARPGVGVTSKSRRGAQLAYAQSVMNGAKELSQTDPEMMQNKDLRRVMQYGSLKKAKSQADEFERQGNVSAAQELRDSIKEAGDLAKGRTTTRQQRASLLYASAANGDASVGDIVGSSDLAGSDPAQHVAFLNDVVGKTNKGSGNLGASAGFSVGSGGKVSYNVGEAAQKLYQADPFTMAKDKHWREGGSTRGAAEHILSGVERAEQTNYSSDAERRQAVEAAKQQQAHFAEKLRRAAGNAGADSQANIVSLLEKHNLPSDVSPPNRDDREQFLGGDESTANPFEDQDPNDTA